MNEGDWRESGERESGERESLPQQLPSPLLFPDFPTSSTGRRRLAVGSEAGRPLPAACAARAPARVRRRRGEVRAQGWPLQTTRAAQTPCLRWPWPRVQRGGPPDSEGEGEGEGEDEGEGEGEGEGEE